MNYVIIDIETTGGSPKASKITEIAIYKHDGVSVIDEFSSLVNPEMLIPPFIVRLTGISDRMVADQPRFHEIAKQIIEFTEGCVFVAHNVGFDYGILRHEFKTLGYDFRRPHLCTVRASRYVIPGLESYSLGKLSRNLGIEIIGRHRAGGDALATAHLFTLLLEKDPGNLESFIQLEVNPKILHPNLDLETFDEIPSKTGVYKFYNEINQLIYIGKSLQIKTRIDQHLRNGKTKKGIEMRKEIAKIEYDLTGSELIALLKESQLIKSFKPIYNIALKKSKFPYGLFDYYDENGYHRLFVSLTSSKNEIPLASFSTKREGIVHLTKMCEDHELCQRMCDLSLTASACFNYSIKKCSGACVGEESTGVYNEKVEELTNVLCKNGDSFYIIDKGRHKNEKSLILIEEGVIIGYGYAPLNFQNQQLFRWKRFIDTISEDRDARMILNVFLQKNQGVAIIRF